MCGPGLPAQQSFQPNFTSQGELKTDKCSKWEQNIHHGDAEGVKKPSIKTVTMFGNKNFSFVSIHFGHWQI